MTTLTTTVDERIESRARVSRPRAATAPSTTAARPALPALGVGALGLVGFGALCAIPVVVGAGLAASGGSWYGGLEKPGFAPSTVTLATAWALLGAVLTWSTWLVWRSEDGEFDDDRRRALAVFGAQLVLATLWALVFFATHAPDLGLLVAAGQWLAALGLLSTYAPVHPWAAAANVPYLAWITFVVAFDAGIVIS